jgi:hypothetical protein
MAQRPSASKALHRAWRRYCRAWVLWTWKGVVLGALCVGFVLGVVVGRASL